MKARRTKIVVTLGPATDSTEDLEKVLAAGADVVRVNFSHGTADEQVARIERVRKCAEKLGKAVGILADLQGPKIRISRFKNDRVVLEDGQSFILDAELDKENGDKTRVGIDYKELPSDVSPNDTLLLDDGRLVFVVDKVDGFQIHCRVKVGGVLSNNKGINRQGGGLSADALTEKDKADIKVAVANKVDFIAVSFPRDKTDIKHARMLIDAAGGQYIGIIAKIERAEAVQNIEEIISASNGVMVARGDLAVEIGDVEVPAVQKEIIARARELNRPVITATQMMESMVENTVPTRAEVSDVANAVLDCTDAVMLSAETAVGKHPDLVVETMARICEAIERHPETQISGHRVECQFDRTDEAIAMATVYTANHMNIKAIIALTESGSTPLLMSRIRTGIPIYGLSRHSRTLGIMTLYRDVYPLYFDVTQSEAHKINRDAVQRVFNAGLLEKGDLVAFTKGDHLGVHGTTNSMKVLTAGEVI